MPEYKTLVLETEDYKWLLHLLHSRIDPHKDMRSQSQDSVIAQRLIKKLGE